MEPYIRLKQIMELIDDVFGFSQTQIAESFLNIDKSQMSNAIKGKRYINRNDLAGVLLGPELQIPADNGNRDRRYAKEQILNHMRGKGTLYPDIEQAADKTYVDVVMAILNHYPPDEKKPKTYDDLMDKGNEYFKNGNYSVALDFYRDAEKQVQGDRFKEMKLYLKMADAFLKLGEYAKAYSLYVQARDNSVFLNGENSFETAKIYECIGVVLRKDRRYIEAKENFENAERILVNGLTIDPDDPYVAKLYNDFGLMNLNDKNFEDTRANYEKAYAIRKNNYIKHGKDNDNFYVLEYAYSVHNMGTYYNKIVTDRLEKLSEDKKKEYLQKAAEYHERAYDLRVDLLNGEDPAKVVKRNDPLVDVCVEIAQSLTQWASDLVELGDINAALKKCELGLKIREAKHGKGAEIQDIAWSFYTMGLIYDKLGDRKKSLNYFSESYRIRLKVCNGDHPYAAKALYQMGRVKYALTYPDALLDLKKAYGIQKQTLKGDDPELLDTEELIQEIERLKNK